MSVHNEEKYLAEAIESILNQTFQAYDFYIIDDGSTDATPEIIKHYCQLDKRILFIQHEKQCHLAHSLNELIQQTDHEYLVRMDGDDISQVERLEKQICYLDKHSDVGVLGTWCTLIDEVGHPIAECKVPETDTQIRQAMNRANAIVHPAVAVRRSVYEAVGGYNKAFRYSQDYELWSRAARVTKFGNLPDFLVYHRLDMMHVSGVSRSRSLFSFRAQMKWLLINRATPINWVYLLRPLVWALLPSVSSRLE